MSTAGSQFLIDDGILVWFNRMDIKDEATEAFESIKTSVEAYAQSNAPWSDRTGAARAGLTADVVVKGTEVILELYHTVDYGLWLEVIQNGNFAIIEPTLQHFAPLVFQGVEARIASVRGSIL